MRTARPTVTVTTPRKKPGPRSISTTDAPPAYLHLTLAPEDYDEAWRLAHTERVTVQEIVRRALRELLERHHRDDTNKKDGKAAPDGAAR